MQSEIIDINKIKKNPDNPRLIKDSQYQTLIRSIKEFPEMLKLRPLVLDESNTILGGNMRYEACRELGIKEIPVIYARGLTDKQKKEFIIKDNLSYGEWDYAMLANEWDYHELDTWGLTLPNFDLGHEANNMDENDIDLEEEFDPIGNAKNLTKIVIIFDNQEQAKEFHENNLSNYKYNVQNGGTGGDSRIWQINLSSVYGK